jgi:phosphohistidine phosphatase
MKTVYILRHAKSSWDFPHLSDHDRPLLDKGIKRTKLIGGYLAKNNITPDLIISSSAVRALETARIVAKNINYPVENIQINRMVYNANADGLTDLLYGIPDNIGSVMLVGHNPTFTSLANQWLDQPVDWLPTSALVAISFETKKWEDLSTATYKTKFVVTPRMLKNLSDVR